MNNELLNLPFDQYGRYKTIADFVLANKNRIKTVLDIGGGTSNLLQRFLPDVSVTVLDMYEKENENYVQGDALNLPFEDNEFDLVVSCDVFEHIESGQRQQFVSGQLRVAKEGVVVAAPFYSQLAVVMEENVNGFYKSLMSRSYPWLKEHLDQGLPKQSEIENLLNERKLKYKKIGQSNLLVWEKLIKNNILVGEVDSFREEERRKSEKLNRIYNQNLFENDFNSLPYRYFYFINVSEVGFNYNEYFSSQIDLEKNVMTNFALFSEKVLNKIVEKLIYKSRQVLYNEKKQVEAELQILSNSISWKITKPFRVFWSLFKK